MDDLSKPYRNPDYRLETVDGDVMLFHPAKTQIHYLNQTAALIWQLCDGSRSIGEMILLLQENYPEAQGDIPNDVRATLHDLKQKGCLNLA